MGTYRVFTKGLAASIRITVEGEQVVSALREAYAATMGLHAFAEASIALYLVAAPPAEEPSQEEAEAAAIPSNLMKKGGAALVEGAYYLAVDTRPPITAPATGGEFHGFPLNPQHPTPRGWTQCVSLSCIYLIHT